MARPKTNSVRLQIALSGVLFEKIEAYADTMGITLAEAGRHLMLRGLEQVQMLVSAKNSADALNTMTKAFDRGLAFEEEREKAKRRDKKKASSVNPRSSREMRVASVGGLVTPPQSPKNDTECENIKDMFADVRHG